MRSTLLVSPAYELCVDMRPTPHGHHLRFVSLVPIARRPEEQVRFQALLDPAALQALRSALDRALADVPAQVRNSATADPACSTNPSLA